MYINKILDIRKALQW